MAGLGPDRFGYDVANGTDPAVDQNRIASGEAQQLLSEEVITPKQDQETITAVNTGTAPLTQGTSLPTDLANLNTLAEGEPL